MFLALATSVALAAAPAQASTLPSGRTEYRSPAEYQVEIAQLAAEHPDSVRRVEIGTSVEGRPLAGVEIADGVARSDDGRPVALVVGLIHAREWPSGEIAMEFAHQLATGGGRFARVRARSRTFVFPLANPDGYEISRTTEAMRRTNARGVDLNRNAGAYWGGPDASDDPTSERYRGPAPWSEPEAQALHAFSATHQVTVVNLLHGYGRSVLFQPGFTRTDAPGLPAGTPVPGHRRFAALARRMAEAAGYVAAPAAEARDITGAIEDWNYFTQFATAFTIEIGSDAFQPPYAQVEREYPGVASALLDAGEEALARRSHAVLRGTAPAGSVLRLSRAVRTPTSYVITGTDTPHPRTGPARTLRDRLLSRLTVPASGRFVWHVNPSLRPVDVLAGRRAAWTLRCGTARRELVLRLGARRIVHLRCAG